MAARSGHTGGFERAESGKAQMGADSPQLQGGPPPPRAHPDSPVWKEDQHQGLAPWVAPSA